ncbi:GSCFA domain-containing protein [Flavobacterium sp. Fl-77]|uniref:GSCFA domain-containing protein n=1 Tax=Flavobacterium flavipigmentatum TaxID=2893884 RepID=A0AAJ2SAZ7_9FLAO|nr:MULTISPECIES: GSCFA domain-containing protein [unclassified Flavobacterium]MDX6183119.1 GSCFA domain-containing protein [Flavobacterium sp. Fl-33]MDX6186812.1 GSCFA domain-containing protein [Flavobacterium sp. Fl-77]UFH40466.1 GSCFA domain-containing protein [Flavobacterium sp. F-70]
MQFRTQIPISKANNPIDYNSKIVSIGSCFAENMADKFDYFKFQNATNPFGIIFNSVSIENIIRRVIEQDFFSEKDIFFHNDLWHCYEVHSELSDPNKDHFLENLNQIIKAITSELSSATHLIITYGTSWIYRNIESNNIVANCHKVPQKQFSKELLSVNDIQKSIQNTVGLIRTLNPNITFIFTISPVRHIKDGFVENQRSKSHLFAALHQTFDFQLSTFNYFPSYEIMMDELRDYRFYAEDMLHPNQLAINYIWQRFSESFIDETAFTTMNQILEIQKGLTHRSFNPNSEQHQAFLSKLRLKISAVEEQWPHIKF